MAIRVPEDQEHRKLAAGRKDRGPDGRTAVVAVAAGAVDAAGVDPVAVALASH